MESLDSAVVDITRLIALCRALRSVEARGTQRGAVPHRRTLRAELKRSAGAYLKTLARARDGVVDEAALMRCRLAAERCMPDAIASVHELGGLMDSAAGALDGLSTTRHDLWRLSHIAIHLREGAALLRRLQSNADDAPTRKVAKSLQRQFRRAMVAYANAAVQQTGDSRRSIRRAREAAIGRLGAQCVDVADQLAWLEAELARPHDVIQAGVAQPLRNLLLDWAA
jgi:hypothetical protein